MKRIIGYEDGKPVFQNVTWRGHRGECGKCAEVDIERSATYVYSCAEGGPLLNEELINRQRPIVKKKQEEVKEWAIKAGVFKV